MSEYLAQAVLDFVRKVGAYRCDPPSHVLDLAPAEMKAVLDKLVTDGRVRMTDGAYRVADDAGVR